LAAICIAALRATYFSGSFASPDGSNIVPAHPMRLSAAASFGRKDHG
jgi:hypothetical protein